MFGPGSTLLSLVLLWGLLASLEESMKTLASHQSGAANELCDRNTLSFSLGLHFLDLKQNNQDWTEQRLWYWF